MTSAPSRTNPLPRSAPHEQGVNPQGLLDFLEAAADLELHSLMVLRHGHVLAEGWWAPHQPDDIQLLYSLSKSFTSTAAGFAIAEEHFGLDDRVLDFFPEAELGDVDDHLRDLRVRHLLSMATGHLEDTLDRVVTGSRQDLAHGFLAIPPDQEPGSIFCYNNTATYMVSVILQRTTGERLLDYLRPRLLDPLGITDALWQQDSQGHNIGFSGLHLATEAIARFGQLYLQQGIWDDQQLLPPGWVEEATRVHITTEHKETVDWQQGYGFQFWRARHGYRGDGAYGQFCIILPEQQSVIAITSATEDMQAVLDAAWTHLLPAMQESTIAPDPEAQGRLTATLAGLSLPTITDAVPTAEVDLALQYLPAADWPDGTFPAVDAITVARNDARWSLRLTVATSDHLLPCGSGSWADSVTPISAALGERVRATGGWTSPSTFTAEVSFARSPHRLLISCENRDGRPVFQLGWNVPPLGSAR